MRRTAATTGRRLRTAALLLAACGLSLGASRPATPATASRRPAADPVSLHALARTFALEPSWVERDKKLRLKGRSADLLFVLGTRESTINGLRVFLGDATTPARRTIAISALDRDRLFVPILAPEKLAAIAPVRTIALDAGHGGHDTGTRNTTLKLEEKDLTIDVARRLKPLLEARGFKVVLTRTDDTYVPLPERPARAAAAGADLFLSIHFNAVDNAAVRGVETYVLTPQYQRSTVSDKAQAEDDVATPGNRFDGWSTHLGYVVHRQLKNDLDLFDRGLKRARFVVLRELASPGILIEGGFLTNAAEARLIATPAYRDKLAAAIVAGVEAYNFTLLRLQHERRAQADASEIEPSLAAAAPAQTPSSSSPRAIRARP